MERIKREYQAPTLVDQGSVVSRTMTSKGQHWDGVPYEDDTKTGSATEPVGTDDGDVPAGLQPPIGMGTIAM